MNRSARGSGDVLAVGTEGLPIFTPVVETPLPAPAVPVPTSRAAAQAYQPRAGTDRATVYRAIVTHGRLAEFQIEELTRLHGNTVRPRLRELEKLGLIQKTQATVPTPMGREAVLYEATTGPQAPSSCP